MIYFITIVLTVPVFSNEIWFPLSKFFHIYNCQVLISAKWAKSEIIYPSVKIMNLDSLLCSCLILLISWVHASLTCWSEQRNWEIYESVCKTWTVPERMSSAEQLSSTISPHDVCCPGRPSFCPCSISTVNTSHSRCILQ